MKRYFSDAHKAECRQEYPFIYFMAEFTAMLIFFLVMPIGVIVGAIWQGLRTGFVMGRDI